MELGLASAAHITVMNRDPKKAETIAALVRDNTSAKADVQAWDGDASVPEDVDILINATSIGLGDSETMPPLKVETLRKGLIVADVIPNPPRTRLLREAEGKGCTALDGLGMLVNQGVICVEHWLGKTLDAGVMEKTLKDIFGAA